VRQRRQQIGQVIGEVAKIAKIAEVMSEAVAQAVAGQARPARHRNRGRLGGRVRRLRVLGRAVRVAVAVLRQLRPGLTTRAGLSGLARAGEGPQVVAPVRLAGAGAFTGPAGSAVGVAVSGRAMTVAASMLATRPTRLAPTRPATA